MSQHIRVPSEGQKITLQANGALQVPDHPIIPYIEGDGVGRDVTPVMITVVDAAVAKAYAGQRQIHWMEIYAGDKAVQLYGEGQGMPAETLQAVREYLVSIKGPLSTPVGGGHRSLNVALRQELDLYVCLRPVRYFQGVPSPLKDPSRTDMVVFRENSEDLYAGIEFEARSEPAQRLIEFLTRELGIQKIRFPQTSGIGIKPVSIEGTERLMQRPSVDVITGLIKANIPTRIAFQVSSKIDSRTILDQMGAEALLGMGDMLYQASGTGLPVRVHGAFVSDEEVHRVVSYLKTQGEANYIEGVLEGGTVDGEGGEVGDLFGDGGGEKDPMYDQAVEVVLKNRKASISLVQRHLKIGYNRAARLVEDMEKAGLVSAMSGSGQREILVPARAE
jgi:hypothetical protein